MAKSVNGAFAEFMLNTINLDKDIVKDARISLNNLWDNLSKFDNIDGFFDLGKSFNLLHGSFSRKTKYRELDDIDMMVGISASGASYSDAGGWADVSITASETNKAQIECTDDNGRLNSTKVLNRFKKEIEKLNNYKQSDVSKDKQVVKLDLISKYWSFDIAPCFHTKENSEGKSFYLIPNGTGNWIKTDPTIDRDRMKELNAKHDGKMLPMIRLVKKWNKHAKVLTIDGYVMECLIAQYFKIHNNCKDDTHELFIDVLDSISVNLFNPIMDPKNIQGDLNKLSNNEKWNLKKKASNILEKTSFAIKAESSGDIKRALVIWKDIFGDDFPTYG